MNAFYLKRNIISLTDEIACKHWKSSSFRFFHAVFEHSHYLLLAIVVTSLRYLFMQYFLFIVFERSQCNYLWWIYTYIHACIYFSRLKHLMETMTTHYNHNIHTNTQPTGLRNWTFNRMKNKQWYNFATITNKSVCAHSFWIGLLVSGPLIQNWNWNSDKWSRSKAATIVTTNKTKILTTTKHQPNSKMYLHVWFERIVHIYAYLVH